MATHIYAPIMGQTQKTKEILPLNAKVALGGKGCPGKDPLFEQFRIIVDSYAKDKNLKSITTFSNSITCQDLYSDGMAHI